MQSRRRRNRPSVRPSVRPSIRPAHPSIRPAHPSIRPSPTAADVRVFFLRFALRARGRAAAATNHGRAIGRELGGERSNPCVDRLSIYVDTYIHTYIHRHPSGFPFRAEQRDQEAAKRWLRDILRFAIATGSLGVRRSVCVCAEFPACGRESRTISPPPAFSKGGHLFSSAYLCTNRPVFVRPSRSSDVYIYALVRVCSIVPANPGRTWVHIQDVYTYMYVGFDLFFLFLFSFLFFLFRFRHHGRTQSFLSFVPQHTRTSM